MNSITFDIHSSAFMQYQNRRKVKLDDNHDNNDERSNYYL